MAPNQIESIEHRMRLTHSVAFIFLCMGALSFYGGWISHFLETQRPVALMLIVIFTASFLSSLAGFAFSAICGALLLHIMKDSLELIQILLICSITIQVLSVIHLFQRIDWKKLSLFLVGGIAGIPMGLYLLFYFSKELYLQTMAIFLIVYGSYMLFKPPLPLKGKNRYGDVIAGMLGGVSGGFAAFPGAFVTIWCSFKPWDKFQQRSIYQPYILCMQVLTLALLLLYKPHVEVKEFYFYHSLLYTPAALLGAWSGLHLFKFLSDRQFRIVVNMLLVLSGVGLLF